MGRVLPEGSCEHNTRYYSGGRYYYPRWGYGGTVQGNTLRGFTSAPTSGAHVVSSSGRTISRGGFGGFGSGGFG